MSEPQARHASPDVAYADDDSAAYRLDTPRSTRTVRFWALPILVTVVLLAALAAFYLGGILKPMTNLRHFPVAITNEDAGPTGAQVVKGMLAAFDHDAYDVRVLDPAQARKQLDTAQIYGVAVIPPNFSSKLQAYAKSALTPGRVERAVIVISTNPRAGTLGASIAGQTLQREVALIDQRVGQRLSQEVAEQTGKKPEPGAVALMLANPVEVKSTVHNALAEGTGNGLSAFYYALLLVLAGFIGSIVVSMFVNSMLGMASTEFFPVSPPTENVSRFRTLLVTWAMMAVVALLASAAYLVISAGLGMPVQNKLTLWLFGAFAIFTVGVASASLIAAMGAIGIVVGLFVFVILGIPAAGAAVPLQATPAWFEWLASFEPLHQVFVGARSLLYLGGRADAGLSQSLEWSTVGLVIGVLFGGAVTRLYDRRGRTPAVAATGAAADPAEVPYPEQ
ncbi:ABC transporter permease [Mycobacterium sp.]|uniref:YhgE/Pip domain-containing protein n=1 Tax=Mycobacterium sp. TaxID=1785 RepID=UPI0031D90734